MNKSEKEHLRQLLNSKYGPGAKFLAQFLIETERINEQAIRTGYKEKRQEFEALCNEYKTQLEVSSSSQSKDQSPIINKPVKKNPEIELYQKFKTPLVNKTNGIIKQSNLADILKNEEQNQEQTNKNRKRSALIAEISVLHDENSSAHDDDEQDDKDLKKSLFKSENAETKSKKVKVKISKKKGESKNKHEDENTHDEDEANTSVSSNTKKNNKNPSKKTKLNDVDENEDEKPSKKGSKKKKTTKTSDIEGDLEDPNKKSKKTKKGKKTKASEIGLNEPKTPVAQDQQHRKSRLELLQSTVKKTIKKRPMTRRAVAAAAAAAADKAKTNLKTPSTLKKVNKFEFNVAKAAQSKVTTISNQEDSAKTPLVHRNKVINNLVHTASKIKANFRTSIDERKARTSQAKLEAKRKSVKKAQAILKSIQNERKLSNTFANNTKMNQILTDDEDDEESKQDKVRPSRMSTDKEKEMIENILKSVSPKIFVQKIPNNMLNSNTISAAKVTAFNDNQKRLTKDLMSSASIQQNYRILQPMSKITTPAKANPSSSTTNANQQQTRTSFIKFLERNTPSKLTRAELEEKQKAELALKDFKEKERLALLEKQKQQVVEDKKKKREEKMKKINELKIKSQQEQEKKQRELQLQMTASKPTTSSSCLNLNQLKSNTTTTSTTNSSQIPTSSSSSSLATLNKKTNAQTASNKPTFDQTDFSTFSTELSNFKQINEHLKNGITSTNTDDLHKDNHKNMCETTYVLNSPSKQGPLVNKVAFTNYQVTPLQPPRLKNQDNYDVSDLRSEDETDDDEEPSKPVPDWARDPKLVEKVKRQAFSMFNFTRLYKAASQSEIILEDIFKIRRKKFTERSSSAIWNSSPIWKGNGINGEESFWQFKKHY